MSERRMVYKLSDINALNKEDLFEYELLMDRTKNDLIIVNPDKSTFSFKDYITDITKDFLTTNHTKLTNQHPVATKNNNGFLSKEDKIKLDNAIISINQLMEFMSTSLKTGSFSLDDTFTYTIVEKGLKLSGIIRNNNISISLNENKIIDIGERPDSDFINANNKVGYRDDLIYCDLDDDYNIKILKDIIFDDTTLIVKGIKCKYNHDRHTYIINDTETVPLLRIRRRNKNLISSSNILGKLTDSNLPVLNKEIIDISRRQVGTHSLEHLLNNSIQNINKNSGTRIHSKILKTNAIYKVDPRAFCYISFNNNDLCEITNQLLNKENMYKRSPFGYMLRKSRTVGNLISFEKTSNFVMEFLLDVNCLNQTEIESNSIILLQDSALNNNIVVSGDIDSKSIIISGYRNNEFVYDLLSTTIDTNDRYHFIKLVIYDGMASLYVDEKIKQTTIIDPKVSQFIQVCSTDFSIGNVMLTKNKDYVNELINKNTYLIENNITNGNNFTLISHKEKFDYYNNPSDNFNVKFSLINQEKISKNDAMYIYFNNEIIDSPIDTGCKITMVNGNKITINTNVSYFNIGDTVKITNELDNIENRYTIIDIVGSIIYLDQIIKSKYIGYIFTKFELTNPAKITINGEPANHMIRGDYYIKVLFDKEYELDNISLEMEYIEKVSEDNTIERISDLDSALFGDKFATNSTNVLCNIEKHNMSMYLNGNVLTIPDKSKPFVMVGNDIEFKLEFNIKDFINLYEDKNTILDSLKILLTLELTGGSNDIEINGTKVNTEGYIIPYKLTNETLNIDNNFNVSVTIKTTKGTKNGKLIISDINCICYLDDLNTFSITNDSGKVTDFAIISDEKVFISSGSSIEIYAEEVEDNYVLIDKSSIENKMITNITDTGYSLISLDNLIRLVHNSDGKCYYLDHFYIV